jgi:hypothetical protein
MVAQGFGLDPRTDGYYEPSGLLQGRPILFETREGGRPLNFVAARRPGLEIGRGHAG